MADSTDVVIAGGSVAGTALATLLGRQDVRVTVLEKSPKPEHYKVTCTHFIQAGATPVFARLGLTETMENAGAIRNGLDIFTPGGGWYSMPDDAHGYSLRREKLDPMLRELAARTPNVEVRQGVTVTALTRDATGRPSGLRGRTPAQKQAIRDALLQQVWPDLGGAVKPVTDRVFPLPEAGQAHEFMAKTGHIGKILLKMA